MVLFTQLRPENILLVPTTSTQHNYIANINFDFGMGKNTKVTQEIKGCVNNNNNNVELEPGCDIWALGCIVLEMLTGKNMWDGIEDSEIEDLLCRIGNGHGFLKLSSEIISREAKGFLKGCLEREAVDRLTAEQLLNHPFVAAAAAAADGVPEEISTTGGDMQEVLEEEEEGTDDDLDFIPLEIEESQEAAVSDGEGLSEEDEFIQPEVEDLQEGSEAGYTDDDEAAAAAYFNELTPYDRTGRIIV